MQLIADWLLPQKPFRAPASRSQLSAWERAKWNFYFFEIDTR